MAESKFEVEVLSSSCWCQATEVLIPVEWVSEGRTGSCSLPDCKPGCSEHVTTLDPYEDEDVANPAASRKRQKMNRFRTERYDARDESSEGYRTSTGAVRSTYPQDLVLVTGIGLCPCGCAVEPKGGSKATFGMGHDIRLRGKLIRAETAGIKVVLVDPEGTVVRVDTPLEIASYYSTAKLDWEQNVREGAKRNTERISAKQTGDKAVLAKAIGPQVGDTKLIKVGRWDKTGTVVAVYDNGGRIEYEYSDAKGTVHRVSQDADGKLREVS